MAVKNLDVTVLDMDDNPVPKEKGIPLLLKDVAITALNGNYADEQSLSGEEKFKRFDLAMKVNKGGEQDYTPEEIVLIKRIIGKAYGPLIVGRAFEVLNA